MKLEFNNVNEIFEFLKDIGYVVNKKEDKQENLNIKTGDGEWKTLEYDWDKDEGLKEKDNKWTNPFIPYYPITPTYPSYPTYPITMNNHTEKTPEVDPNNTKL